MEIIETGIRLLDLLFTKEGGIPRGKFIEITSESGVGKTTMLLDMSRRLCSVGYKILFMDVEDGLTDETVDSFGLKPFVESGNFIVTRPITFRNAEDILIGLIGAEMKGNETVDLIMLDSISTLVPEVMADDDKSIEDSSQKGTQARLEKALLKKFRGMLGTTMKTIFFITQRAGNFAMGPAARFAPKTKSSVGKAFEFYMDIRVKVDRIKKMKQATVLSDGSTKEIEYGAETKIHCFKNKCGQRPFIPIEIPLVYGKGISDVMLISNILTKSGAVNHGGSYYYPDLQVGDKRLYVEKIQGKMNFYAFVKENINDLNEYIKENNLIYLYKEQ